MDNPGEQYPIIEALCEFQFNPSQPWDMTVPGIFYEKIKEEFPIKKQQMGIGVGFQPKLGTIEQKVEMTQRIQFVRSDESALVQLRPDVLVVNQLKPYPTWEIFKPLILNNLNKYISIANPKGFKRIGLRYINRIAFLEDKVDITDYFKYHPHIPKELPQIHGPFNFKTEFFFEEGRDHLILNLLSVEPANSEKTSIVFDLDYILLSPGEMGIEGADQWLEKAHSGLNNAFKACLTDKCKTIVRGSLK